MNIQPMLIIAILNFFQVQRYDPPLTLAMTAFTSSKLHIPSVKLSCSELVSYRFFALFPMKC